MRDPPIERPTALKRHDAKTDTRGVDAAERKEILNRYRDHSRRFEAAAARRSAGRSGAVIPEMLEARLTKPAAVPP